MQQGCELGDIFCVSYQCPLWTEVAVNCDEIKVGPVARMGGEKKCMKIFGAAS